MSKYTRFIRRLNNLEMVIEKLEDKQIYLVDSFPVELCNITRERMCNLWNDKKLKGYKIFLLVFECKICFFIFISTYSTVL